MRNRVLPIIIVAMSLSASLSVSALTIDTNTGSSSETQTTFGLNAPATATVEALSHGGTTYSLDQKISSDEMVWLKQGVHSASFDDDKTYLLPIKSFEVCLLSSNEDGLFVKVVNSDFTGQDKGQKIQTVVELVTNGAASSGSSQLLFASSDRRGDFASSSIQFVDSSAFNTSSAQSINTASSLINTLTDRSPGTNQSITSSTHAHLIAASTMQRAAHYSIVQGGVTAADNKNQPTVTANGVNFLHHTSSFAPDTCGANNVGVVKIYVYLNLQDLALAENDAYNATISYTMCTESDCS
jgi:hypothetical protein